MGTTELSHCISSRSFAAGRRVLKEHKSRAVICPKTRFIDGKGHNESFLWMVTGSSPLSFSGIQRGIVHPEAQTRSRGAGKGYF